MVRPQDVEGLTDDGVVTKKELRTHFPDEVTGDWPTARNEWGWKLYALKQTGQIRAYSGAPYTSHPDNQSIPEVSDVAGIGSWGMNNDKSFDEWLIDNLDWSTNQPPEGSNSDLTSGERAALSVGAEPEQVVGDDVSTTATESSGTNSGEVGMIVAIVAGVVALAVAVLGGN